MSRRFITSDTLRDLMRSGMMRLELTKSDVVTDDARELAARSGLLFLMPSFRRPLVAGNWKMNGDAGSAKGLAAAVASGFRSGRERLAGVDVMIAPPAPFLAIALPEIRDTGVILGAQNCHFEEEGAYTGETGVNMLRGLGVKMVIVGHSERRRLFGETDAVVAKKVARVAHVGLVPILCVGETLAERVAGQAEVVVGRQLEAGLAGLEPALVARVIVAYEPVWAIGTGRVAELPDIDAMHRFARETLLAAHGGAVAAACRILYGGSVSAKMSFPISKLRDVDGALVGGASLEADEFLKIVGHFAEAHA